MESVVIWYTDVRSIDKGVSFSSLLDTLDPSSRERAEKYRFMDDQKRSTLSSLLQKAAVANMYSLNSSEYSILRTRENKPFLKADTNLITNWNFNVSHHGDYVALVSHSSLLVGCDIVDTKARSNFSPSAQHFFTMFERQLTAKEMKSILCEKSEEMQYNKFYILWSLKEAYIKAIGLGLGFNLQDIEFDIAILDQASVDDRNVFYSGLCGEATVRVQGVLRPDWKFDFTTLGDGYVLTVGRGPLHEAIKSFKRDAWPNQQDAAIKDLSKTPAFVNQVSSALPAPILLPIDALLQLCETQSNFESERAAPIPGYSETKGIASSPPRIGRKI